jgi:hypothetical protein
MVITVLSATGLRAIWYIYILYINTSSVVFVNVLVLLFTRVCSLYTLVSWCCLLVIFPIWIGVTQNPTKPKQTKNNKSFFLFSLPNRKRLDTFSQLAIRELFICHRNSRLLRLERETHFYLKERNKKQKNTKNGSVPIWFCFSPLLRRQPAVRRLTYEAHTHTHVPYIFPILNSSFLSQTVKMFKKK